MTNHLLTDIQLFQMHHGRFCNRFAEIVVVVTAQAKGSVLIHQKMFESRLFFVDKLIDMGAKIILCDPHRATQLD